MPDVFAPVVVLALLLLGFAGAALSRGGGAVARAARRRSASRRISSHLPLALAIVGAGAAARGAVARRAARGGCRWRRRWRCCSRPMPWGMGARRCRRTARPSCWRGCRRTGRRREVIRARCPDAGWYLCAFADRLPMDANDFLWAPDSPVNRDAARHAALPRRRAALGRGRRRSSPRRCARIRVAVARAMLRNTLRAARDGAAPATRSAPTTWPPRCGRASPRASRRANWPPSTPRCSRAAHCARRSRRSRLVHAPVLLLALPLLALARLARRAGARCGALGLRRRRAGRRGGQCGGDRRAVRASSRATRRASPGCCRCCAVLLLLPGGGARMIAVAGHPGRRGAARLAGGC